MSKRSLFVFFIMFLVLFSYTPVGGEEGDNLQKLDEEGTQLYQKCKYDDALLKFQQAVQICRNKGLKEKEAEFLEKIANLYFSQANYEKSLKYNQMALSVFDGINNKESKENRAIQGRVIRSIGMNYFLLCQYDKAMEYFQQKMQIDIEIKDRQGEGISLADMGEVCSKKAQYSKALEYYRKGLEIIRGVKDRNTELLMLGNMGVIYALDLQWDKALEYNEQSLKMARELGDKNSEKTLLDNMAGVYFRLNQYPKALEYAEQTLKLIRESGDKSSEMKYLLYMIEIYFKLSQTEKTLETLQLALKISTEIHDRNTEGICLKNMGLIYNGLCQYKKALEYYETALQIAVEIQDRQGEELCLNNMGQAYHNLSQHREALEYYEKALNIAREIGDKQGEAISLGNMGAVYRSISQSRKALEYYEQALKIAENTPDKMGKGRLLGNMGAIYDGLSQYQKALEYYDQSLKILQEIGDKSGEGTTLANMGSIYSNLCQYQKALEYHGQALEIYRETGYRQGESITLVNIGMIYNYFSNRRKALEYYEQALEISRQTGDKITEGNVLQFCGLLYFSLSEHNKASEYYEKAMEIFREIGDKQGEGRVLTGIGMIYFSLAQYPKSLEYFRSALKILKESEDRQGEFTLLTCMGFAYYALGDKEQALEYLKDAITILEEIRSEIKVEELKQDFFIGRMSAFELIMKILLEEKNFQDAFIYVEKAKARTFLDMIGNKRITAREGADQELLEREQQLLDEIRGMDRKLSDPHLSQEEASRITGDLKEKRDEYKKVIEQIKISNSDYASLITVDVRSIPQIQNILSEEEAVIEYFICDTDIYVWSISKDKFTCRTISTTKKELETKVKTFRDLIVPSLQDLVSTENLKKQEQILKEKSQEIYSLIFASVEEDVKGKKRLIIVPHGSLHFLPFSALVDGEGKYIVERLSILMEPSSSALVLFREKQKEHPRTFCGFAYGDIKNSTVSEKLTSDNTTRSVIPDEIRSSGIDPLPATEEEVKTIDEFFKRENYTTKTYYRENFTRGVVEKEIPHAGFIHLSTHGFFISDKKKAEFSGLVTSDDFIYIMDILNWELNARLVVLSACQTGLGSISQGDDMVGLSRALMYAGTDNLIVTLWKVADQSTGELMKDMYAQILSGDERNTPTEALQIAQLQMLKSEKYFHPYFWSPFIIYGK